MRNTSITKCNVFAPWAVESQDVGSGAVIKIVFLMTKRVVGGDCHPRSPSEKKMLLLRNLIHSHIRKYPHYMLRLLHF